MLGIFQYIHVKCLVHKESPKQRPTKIIDHRRLVTVTLIMFQSMKHFLQVEADILNIF